ncbi:class F sortase [Streptomyces sp. NPDC058657]|uniref:class F sortase n=1 Tax=unclassified Streptomyces TaxID=2593676 RepID=UPI003658C2AB
MALIAGLTAGCSTPADGSAAQSTAPRPLAHVTGAKASALVPSVPDRITVPAIGLDAGLDTVGLAADGTMQTPSYDKPMRAAWYRQGPTPGEKGAAVIVGHLDTPKVPKAVFHNLKKLKKNEQIQVRRQDGSVAVFAVDSVDTFKKSQFPTKKVYGRTNGAQLRLITCGGALNDARHWDSNVIVFAHLTGAAAT